MIKYILIFILFITNVYAGVDVGGLTVSGKSTSRIFIETRAPLPTDDVVSGSLVGDVWIDTATSFHYISIDDSSGAAVWSLSASLGSASITALEALTSIHTSSITQNTTDIGDNLVLITNNIASIVANELDITSLFAASGTHASIIHNHVEADITDLQNYALQSEVDTISSTVTNNTIDIGIVSSTLAGLGGDTGIVSDTLSSHINDLPIHVDWSLSSQGTIHATNYVDNDTDTTDHTLLSNIGTNTHAQIDTFITEASTSITTNEGAIVSLNTASDTHLTDGDLNGITSDISVVSGVADTNRINIELNDIDIASLIVASNTHTPFDPSGLALQSELDLVSQTVISNTGDIGDNLAQITINVASISALEATANVASIVALEITSAIHSASITDNQNDIASNFILINTNTASITQNISDIGDNATDITTVSGTLSSHINNIPIHIDWASANQGTIHGTNYVDNDTTDHTSLSNIGVNTHPEIDAFITDAASSVTSLQSTVSIHEASIIQNAFDIANATDFTASITENITNISINTASITQNITDIGDNLVLISNNTASISALIAGDNTASIVANELDIASLFTASGTHASLVHTHLEADITDLQDYALQTEVDTISSTVVTHTGQISSLYTASDTHLTIADFGNLRINGNTVSSINSSGNIIFTPDGAGKVVISSDLQVLGSIIEVSATQLEVTDPNVTVNQGGNQSSADTFTAGVVVDMTDATNAQIGYNSSCSHFFEAGEVGSLECLAGETSITSLTNASNTHLTLADLGSLDSDISTVSSTLTSHINDLPIHIDWASSSQGTIHATNYVDNDTTDHTALSNIGVNSHPIIDSYITDSSSSITTNIFDISSLNTASDTHLTDGDLSAIISDISIVSGVADSNRINIELNDAEIASLNTASDTHLTDGDLTLIESDISTVSGVADTNRINIELNDIDITSLNTASDTHLTANDISGFALQTDLDTVSGTASDAYVNSLINIIDITSLNTASDTHLTDGDLATIESDISTVSSTLSTHINTLPIHVDWALSSQGTIHATNYVDNDTTDHTALSNIGTNSHDVIDSYITDSASSITTNISSISSLNTASETHLTDGDLTQIESDIVTVSGTASTALVNGFINASDISIVSGVADTNRINIELNDIDIASLNTASDTHLTDGDLDDIEADIVTVSGTASNAYTNSLNNALDITSVENASETHITEIVASTNITVSRTGSSYEIAASGGGGGNFESHSFSRNNSPYLTVTNQTYTAFAQIIYRGSSMFSPTEAEVIARIPGAGEGFIRIRDITNSQTIAESAGFTNAAFAIIDLGTISNLSAGEAIWEIQMKNTQNNQDVHCGALKLTE